MALIYANAVNKRMNQPSRKKKSSPCPYHEDSTDEGSDLRRSSSKEISVSRKQSTITSANVVDPKHRPVQRSKTSCGDLYLKKLTEEEVIRKSSHPVMSQSITAHSLSSPKKGLKMAVLKKYNLENGHSSTEEKKKVERRRSVSLDPEQWNQEFSDKKDAEDEGPFQKMKRKFSKWRFPGT